MRKRNASYEKFGEQEQKKRSVLKKDWSALRMSGSPYSLTRVYVGVQKVESLWGGESWPFRVEFRVGLER